jgi:single-strand DNA-binding protein
MAEAVITVVGNLTKDPELKFLNNGTAAVRFGVAVTKKWKDRDGAPQEQTSFFDCSAIGTIAQGIADHLRKGDRAIVTGSLEQRSWQTDTGDKRSVVEIKVEACGADLRWASEKPRSVLHESVEEPW